MLQELLLEIMCRKDGFHKKKSKLFKFRKRLVEIREVRVQWSTLGMEPGIAEIKK
jgi:hypothetical protein